jgi:DNA primase
MTPFIPEDRLTEIRERINIVDLVSNYVNIKRIGKNYVGLCPFHSEKTPSFNVSEDKQMFYCFGCGVGGNVFTFLMKYENISFLEAAKSLAEKAGVSINIINHYENKGKSRLFEINEKIAEYFHNILLNDKEGDKARDYLKKRGISKDIILEYKLGFSKNSRDDLLKYIKKENIELDIVKKLGLIMEKDKAFYSFFRGRLIFPIFNIMGKIIGFGGRVLDDVLPKYINSCESSIYSKSNSLYGINIAKDYIRKKGFSIIVEGYFDLISLHKYGFKNSVATLGTALTSNHIKILKRYSNNVIGIFDGDRAGISAIERSVPLFLNEEMQAKVIILPQGMDPDEFVNKVGDKKLADMIATAIPIISFIITRKIKNSDISSIEGRTKLVKELIPIIESIKSPIERHLYVKMLGENIDVNEEVILNELKGFYKKEKRGNIDIINNPYPDAEDSLLKLIIRNPSFIKEIESSQVILDFESKERINILKYLLDYYNKYGIIDILAIIDLIKEESLKLILTKLSISEDSLEGIDEERFLKDCIKKIKINRLRKRQRDISKRLGIIKNSEDYRLLLEKKRELYNKEKELNQI